MNYFHFILWWQLAFIIDDSESHVVDCKFRALKNPSVLPDHVRLRILNNGEYTPILNLKRIERVLANVNLPIWILNGVINKESLDSGNTYGLDQAHKVMQQLGDFTTYQDPETTSAAIYFHDRREFDGMIGYKYTIRRLSIDTLDVGDVTSLTLNQFGVFNRMGYEGHTNDRKFNEKDLDAGVNYQEHMKTYEGRVYEGYPEVLVIVSWDVAEEWTQNAQESERNVRIVSHVLTLFNGVDMLYSKLKYTKIQINIAGIIIGSESTSFLFLQECYELEITERDGPRRRLHGSCVNNVLRRFLDHRRDIIRPDSYDMVIFLTGENIYDIHDGEKSYKIFNQLGGIAGSVEDLYECRRYDEHVILVGTITSSGYLDKYPTIAHEMAHLMTLNHDSSSLFTPDGKCKGNLLKIVEKWCDRCLSWSETSEETFKLFFSSPNCCAFINQPRSLRLSGPSSMLTAYEQCQCYGFQSAWSPDEEYLSFCNEGLLCWNGRTGIESTVIPMDGTPCLDRKVCWERQCRGL